MLTHIYFQTQLFFFWFESQDYSLWRERLLGFGLPGASFSSTHHSSPRSPGVLHRTRPNKEIIACVPEPELFPIDGPFQTLPPPLTVPPPWRCICEEALLPAAPQVHHAWCVRHLRSRRCSGRMVHTPPSANSASSLPGNRLPRCKVGPGLTRCEKNQ